MLFEHMIAGNIKQSHIYFDAKAWELQHGNNMEVDETMARIRLMHDA